MQVSNSQQQTLEHLLLYESAVSDLQASGTFATERRLPLALQLACTNTQAVSTTSNIVWQNSSDLFVGNLSCAPSNLHDIMQEAAQAANISYTQLLSRCRLLSSKLRGVDLLAGRVAVLKHAVEQLEAVVEVVLTDMGTNRAV